MSYDFIFKPFEEMTDEDYAEIGFMCGLEVHQQLLTSKKLFCRCPAGKYSQEYNAEILRHMRPTLSELGEYDPTALMEFKTKKDIIYHIHYDTVCTYEMDDTPPFEMNDEALDIAIEIGMLTGSSIVDEIHIARKQYLDGSIPTGFQRTAIISVGGSIPYKNRNIGIIQMSIEEDSCREESDIGHTRTFITDRLGMPLIETVTRPDMKTPFEVAEVNDIIRRLVRSTGKVRTGIGAGRQDVNVSVRGGTRIEIKGVHKIKNIPLLTYNEAMRQWNLLRLREELHRRGITAETFLAKIDDITKLVNKTYYQPVRNAVSEGKSVKCVTLKGFKGLLRWQTQTDTFFSREISDRVRVIACLSSLPNIIHSDSQENTLSTAEGVKIRKAVGAMDDDSLVIVWGNQVDVDTATKEIIIRAKEATIGVPSETRQALHDGTNGFERILPGPDRMYPDTDLPPKRITKERVDEIKLNVTIPFWKYEKWYYELGLPKDIIRPLAFSKYAKLFEFLVKEWKIEPVPVSVALIQFIKKLKKKRLNISLLNENVLKTIFKAYKENKIVNEGIYYAMENVILRAYSSEDFLPIKCNDSEIDEAIEAAKEKYNWMNILHPENKKKIIMGLVMDKLRGRVEGRNIANKIEL
ncbi:MAG: Glu-tRNA(Gln) amidotransferase subunit GatE [FCB group bacterium]|jgi:glutamyl-tRNA(Gln) amidotransferase subunit E